MKGNVSFKKRCCWILFFLMFFLSYDSIFAQDINYIDNNDQYIDVVGEPEGQVQGPARQDRPAAIAGASWQQNDQFSTGILNYGLSESVYYQFSGESIFKDGKPFSGDLLFNWNWTHFKQLDSSIPAAWSYGGEFLYFNATSKSVYSGEDTVSGSSIDMNLYMFSAAIKIFFLDPVKEFLHPYWGVGWGILLGDFTTKKNLTGSNHYTPFNGVLSYQVLGVQIMFMERAGIMAEIKNMRANASTSNDPFDRGNGDSVDLIFDGVIIGLTGFYRF
jgi:hypothetical protein